MSELRINIIDASRAVTGTLHGSFTSAILAGLAAEPETIDELEDAMARYIKPVHNERHFCGFHRGIDEEPWDAGILFVDLAARVVAGESSYSALTPEGEVEYHNGFEATPVCLPYRVPGDWIFLDSVDAFSEVAKRRRAERAAAPPLDARPVLYGALTEFIVRECRAARESSREDPVAEIHAKWLTTPRDDLRGMPPREILLMKREEIDRDIQFREVQWSRLKAPAPCLTRNSHAYRFAGFGTHEIVIYYDLVRMLITRCWEWMLQEVEGTPREAIARLEQVKAEWLDSPDPENGGKTPACLIEFERIRLPWVSDEDDSAFDDDCPLCRAMADSTFGPAFWHLDGCNMDNDFAFSFCRTREEWEMETERFAAAHEGIEQAMAPK